MDSKNCGGCIDDGGVVGLIILTLNPFPVNLGSLECWMMISIADSSERSEESEDEGLVTECFSIMIFRIERVVQ
jgi:hypothetical protein